MALKDTLKYQPNELKFGTSGLRGLLTDMTDLECYINTAGFLKFLQDKGDHPDTIYVAGDLRHSTPRIMQVVAQAVADAGLKYISCGFIPTPAIAYYAGLKKQPCIMVTGSHIPEDRNGIKFYKTDGEVLKEDEPGIKKAVADVRFDIYAEEIDRFDERGSLRQLSELTSIDGGAEQAYVQRYVDYFDADCLKDMKLVMYQHSAVGRDLIPKILEYLGAEVVAVERSDKFVPIDTENVKPSDEELFAKIAKDNTGCFAILSTDGDSDRPFVIDESGVFNRGDVLGLVVSQYLGSEAVAFPISTNDAVVKALESQGVKYEFTKIGSPYVISAMQKLEANHTDVSGWEVNGGFLTGEDYEHDGRELKALPTRDALLPIICALLAARQQGMKLSELFAALPQRFTQAGLIDNFPNEVSSVIVEILTKDDDRAHEIISQCFTAQDGFDEVVDINALDGIRIRFKNDDVAHLRPSGNAPQLRIYSNADSQERADEIVKLAIAEPNGIFRSIERLIKEEKE